MGTAKRERQKANRQARLEELAKEARKQKTRKRSTQIAIFVGGGLVLLFGLAWLFRDDNDDEPATTTTVAPVTSVATDSTAPGDTTGAATDTTVAADTTAAPTTTVAEFTYGTLECPAADGSSELPDAFEDAPAQCIEPDTAYTAVVETNKGSFTIELNTEGAPGTVNNFVTLARYGYYDGRTGCHRVITDFVVQCGRPGEDEEAPGYNIPDELPEAGEYAEGVVAMANTGAPGTGGGQWFVITGEQGASLPPQYSILGTVTAGYDTAVQALENLADPTTNGVPPLLPIEIISIEISPS